jgi:hypothetical protein
MQDPFYPDGILDEATTCDLIDVRIDPRVGKKYDQAALTKATQPGITTIYAHGLSVHHDLLIKLFKHPQAVQWTRLILFNTFGSATLVGDEQPPPSCVWNAFCKYLENPDNALKFIDLESNAITDEQVDQMCRSLRVPRASPHLIGINVSHGRNLTTEGVRAVMELARDRPSLCFLDLESSNIHPIVLRDLAFSVFQGYDGELEYLRIMPDDHHSESLNHMLQDIADRRMETYHSIMTSLLRTPFPREVVMHTKRMTPRPADTYYVTASQLGEYVENDGQSYYGDDE